MKLLDRYIFRQFFMNLLLVLASLVAIYLLVDFFERIDNFTEMDKSIGLALTYFLLKIPFIYDQMAPVCILLAGVITLGLLSKNRELMSLNAGGISLMRIVIPIIAASLLFTLLTIAVAQWILPRTNTRTNEIWYQEVNEQVANGIVRKGRIFYRGKEGIYTFKRPNPKHNDFTQFNYMAWDATRQYPALLLTAPKASWSDKGWSFKRGQLKTSRQDGSFDIKLFKDLHYALPDTPADFFVPEYRVTELSLYELHQKALASLKQGDWRGMVAINQRLSFIFLGVPLLLLSIPLMHSLQRKWNRDLSMTIPISCVLAFFAWALWNVTQSLAQAAYVNPIVASWSIHVILTVTGLILLWRMNRI
ncbi:MAG: LptF/LptG family permease [Proteobacteria bacterium]|nr:LptF/LptG family permease [Pseudomonadota bacterium]MBU0965345.1 LptF/LptG family permease [Pseudomonadota bacterium]